MKHELQIHTEAVYAQMSHFYEVCSHIIALLSPARPQTSDKQLTSLTPQVPLSMYLPEPIPLFKFINVSAYANPLV